MLKRIGSLMLCLALLASGWPVGAMAEEAQPATPAETTEEPCTHAQASESAWEKTRCWSISDEQHVVSTDAYERVECPDCGAVLKDETYAVGEAYAEAHAYNDEGVCTLCEYAAPVMEIMPLSLDITEEETTRAMNLSVDTIVVGQSFSFSWSEVPYADHYEVAVTRIDRNDKEHKLLGSDSNDHRQNVGTNRSFTVSAADVAADTKRMRVYVGAAPDSSFPTAWNGMIKEASSTVDVRYEAAKEMDVRVSVSGDTATVRWDKVAGADHYLYKVLDQTNSGEEICPETQTEKRSFKIRDMVTEHRYKIWVASYDADGALISQHASETKLLLECHHELTADVESGESFGNLTETTHTRYACFDVVCKTCGEVISADQIKAVGQEDHAFTGNVCDACGYDRTDKTAVLALSVGEAISGKPLTASWNAIDGVDHYQYDVKDLTAGNSLFGGMQTTEGTSLTADGAKVIAGHEYKIWAAAYGADGVMLTQGTQTVTAEKITVELTLNVGPAVGGQTLIVTWNEVEGVDHYQYNIRNLSTDTPIWGETGESTKIPSLMLNGILVDDNVEYKIWVGAYDASGSMMAQTTQTVKTTVAQGNPMNISYSGTPLAGVDLEMSWSKLNDADHYEYSLRDITTNKAVYTRVETNTAYFTIPGAKLEADHNYRFWVGAIGADGAEPNRNHQGSVSFMVVQCPHGSATPKNEVATRTSISDTQHHVVKTYDLYCTYCDTMIEEGKTEEYDEEHNLDEAGDCTLCDYRWECKHENQVKSYVDTSYTALEDGKHHRVTDIYSLVCADCGKVIVQLDSSLNETREEEHSFAEDVCTLCGYTKAERFGVTIKLDQQTAKCGEMIGADAVVAGGSGSYKYGWEIYRDGVKVNSNSDCGDRCTYTASGAGQWKFMVRVTDIADDETFWAESASVEVKHDVTSEEIVDKRRIERNDQKTHIVVKTMHVACACGEVDKTEEVREQVEHTKGSARNKPAHPHRKYFVCTVCGQEIDGGEDGYDSGCSTCNPSKTENAGNTGNQNSHGTNQTSANLGVDENNQQSDDDSYHSAATTSGTELESIYNDVERLTGKNSFYNNLVDAMLDEQSATTEFFGVKIPSIEVLIESAYSVLDQTDWSELKSEVREEIVWEYIGAEKNNIEFYYGLMLSDEASLFEESVGVILDKAGGEVNGPIASSGWSTLVSLKNLVEKFKAIDNATEAEIRTISYMAADAASYCEALDQLEKLLGDEYTDVCRDMKNKILEASNENFNKIMEDDKNERDKVWRSFGDDVMQTLGLFAVGQTAAQAKIYVEVAEDMMKKYGETFVTTNPALWKEVSFKKILAGVGEGVDIGTSILAGIKIGNLLGDIGGEFLFGINPGELIDAKHKMIALVPLEVEIRAEMNSALKDSHDNSESLYVYTKLLLSARNIGLDAAEEYGEKATPQLEQEREEIEKILEQIDYYYHDVY